MQIAALILSLVAKTLDFSLAEALPNALTTSVLYSLCLAPAAALSVFGLSEMFEMYLKDEVEHEDNGTGGT
jgi:hypothetical protein